MIQVNTTATTTKNRKVIKEEVDNMSMEGGTKGNSKIRIGIGRTYNLGNFESLRYDCHVEIPCADDDGSIADAITHAENIAKASINEFQEEAGCA